MKKDNKCELCGIHRDEMDSMPIEYYDVFKGKHMFICKKCFWTTQIKDILISYSEEMQNISVMDDDLPAKEYVYNWMNSNPLIK